MHFFAEEVIVLLIDDRKVYGCLRSLDHHGNIVLEGARERIIVGDLYCDVPLGLFVIRGESSILIGQLRFGMEDLPEDMMCVSEEEIKKAQKVEKEAKDLKSFMMKRMGFLDFLD
ncbi:putative LSM domain-containing protein [Lupinus albus]|uniref:Putative LSM domain-containing protein n=1 Tax=Lupinus albus TaxID=3870 RepID=A0A6A4PJ53_LUPAL|nr:putative LSM domain-containing protein [Lupinus albus]